MNKQLLRLKQRSNSDVLQVAESDDSNNLYVNVAASTPIDIDGGTIDEVTNVSDVDSVNLVDEITLLDTLTNITNEVKTTRLQSGEEIESEWTCTFSDSAPQYSGCEHIITKPTITYDKYVLYVENPSPVTTLDIDIKNAAQMDSIVKYGQIDSKTVPIAPYSLFVSTAWSSCFTSIGATLTDESGDLNDANGPDVPFGFGAINDAIYFGHSAPFQRMRLRVGTAGVYTASGIWEYWNGSAWTEFTMSTLDGLQTTPFKTVGWRQYDFQVPSNWAAYDITGDPTSQYWIRFRVTSFTSMTTPPSLTQGYYKPITGSTVHAYIIDGMFNGGNCKITTSINTGLGADQGFISRFLLRRY